MQTAATIVLTVSLFACLIMNFIQFRAFGRLLKAFQPILSMTKGKPKNEH